VYYTNKSYTFNGPAFVYGVKLIVEVLDYSVLPCFYVML